MQVDWTLIGKAAAMFVATNVDDMVVLAVFFGRAAGSRSAMTRVVIGQYLGFIAILAVAVIGALGANLLPRSVLPYLGLLPIAIGVRAAWLLWRNRGHDDDSEVTASGSGILAVAAVTFANGGDNLGVYVPVFAVAGVRGMIGYAVVFLIGVALWCAAGWYLGSRRSVAALVERWGHIILPVVLIGIGLLILFSA